jgi:nucleotide-binding universal stress UspA family protein
VSEGVEAAQGGARAGLRSVLAPTDFSECGLAAIPRAYALVEPGGSVHLLHVVVIEEMPNPLYAHYTPGHVPTPEERARLDAQLRERLESLAPASASAAGVRTVPHVVHGDDVAGLVCAAAEQLDVDAICLGSHGRGGLARMLLGSEAQSVLQHTRREVVVVRPRSS